MRNSRFVHFLLLQSLHLDVTIQFDYNARSGRWRYALKLLEKIFGNQSTKEIKRIKPLVDQVLSLEDEMAKLSDEQLRNKTVEYKERLAKGETLDDLLPEARVLLLDCS